MRGQPSCITVGTVSVRDFNPLLYVDRPIDLADASLVVATLKTGSATVCTLDRDDFETYRLPGRKHFRPV